ncbi:MAG TPA: hypothetical protein VIA18_15575 [Polyangia bacterium]|jgi:hypothetical protein|nr:hypothetical protein [Polyangia bacterium]HWE30081.1 hypothetical protein [Polyangia bacterium]
MANDDWKVLPHEPIEKLSENLWRVVGTIPHIPMRRVMTVARLGDGRLVIHSAIAMDEPSMRELEAWGTPAFLIVPNRYHRMDAARFKKRYPQLKVLTPPRAQKLVATVVPVDATHEEFSDDRVQLAPLAGVGDGEQLLRVRSQDGVTLVLTDCVFNMAKPRSFVSRAITSVLGSAPGPRVTRIFKAAMIKDRDAFRADLERLAATPDLTRLIVAHDRMATGSAAAAALRQAATYV